MKKSLIVAATFAAITLAAANVANAGVAGMLASAPTPTRKSLIRSTIGTDGIGITAGIGVARGVITASTAGGGDLAP